MFKFLFGNKSPQVPNPEPIPLDPTPRIEFYRGLPEVLSDVSLQKNKLTGVQSVRMKFLNLKALESFNSFRDGFNGTVSLLDEEGEIAVTPSSCKIIFGGDDGDDLKGVDFRFELGLPEHRDRFLRFMNRYAEANGMAYGEPVAAQ